MKSLFLLILATLSLSISAQSISPGSLIGVHEMKIQLADGVSMDKYLDHFIDVMIPAYEKAYRGTNVLLTKGKRGECADCIGMMWIFSSEALRDKLFDDQGDFTPYYEKRTAMIQEKIDAQDKLGTIAARTYTD